MPERIECPSCRELADALTIEGVCVCCNRLSVEADEPVVIVTDDDERDEDGDPVMEPTPLLKDPIRYELGGES